MAKKKTKKKNSFWGKIKSRQNDLLSRRTHRSFKLTKQRDYQVKLPMPGYTAFTGEVFTTIFKNKKIFLFLILIGMLLALASSSVMAQDRYLELIGTLRETVESTYGELFTLMGETGSIIITIFFNMFNNSSNELNPYIFLIGVLIWLCTVWIIRNIKAGKKVTIRNALYNSGGPIVSSSLVLLTGVLQTTPAIMAVGIYAIANQSGVMENGAAAMAISMALLGLVILTLYWLTSTFIALIIVTLPNMYPMRAIKLAGDLVSGIRLRILYRILWAFLVLAFFWAIILGIFISLDILLRLWLEWFMAVPLVPFVILTMAVVSVVFLCVYIYMLYLEIVEARHERIS